MFERFTWNWSFFSIAVFLCLNSAYRIRTGDFPDVTIFNLVVGLFGVGFFTRVLLDEKTTQKTKTVPNAAEAEDKKWADYCVKKE